MSDKTEAAYRRGSAIQKRRDLMERWQKFLMPEFANFAAATAVNQLAH